MRVVAALAGTVALGAAGFGVFPDSTPASTLRLPAGLPVLRTGGGCPLTHAEERKAVVAFRKLLPVVQHPRCANCHGGVDPFVEEAQGGHGGGKIDSTDGFLRTKSRCQECHSQLEGWELPILPEMSFVGKSPRELCILFKRMKPVARVFVRHIDNDEGGTQFTVAAFKGERALNDATKDDWEERHGRRFVGEPPPGTHAELVANAQAWTDAMGDGWPVRPEHPSAWEGTVKAWWELRTPELGVLTETAEATVRFAIDSSYNTTDDPAEFWKSVSGRIKWATSNVGGKCRVTASGSLPVGLGGDLNPMANLREEQGEDNTLKFSVAIGPWPDAYTPRFSWRCPENTVPATLLGVTTWWYHDVNTGMLSRDGETMKGRYQSPMGPAVMSWEWDLHMVP
jgi:hypothetical protein